MYINIYFSYASGYSTASKENYNYYNIVPLYVLVYTDFNLLILQNSTN